MIWEARDQNGKKTFYYYINGMDFEFSSQSFRLQLFKNKNFHLLKNQLIIS